MSDSLGPCSPIALKASSKAFESSLSGYRNDKPPVAWAMSSSFESASLMKAIACKVISAFMVWHKRNNVFNESRFEWLSLNITQQILKGNGRFIASTKWNYQVKDGMYLIKDVFDKRFSIFLSIRDHDQSATSSAIRVPLKDLDTFPYSFQP